jgi:hypothetical protein
MYFTFVDPRWALMRHLGSTGKFGSFAQAVDSDEPKQKSCDSRALL